MKYIKLYFTYAKLSLMSKLVYKANLIIGIVAFLFTQLTSILTLYILLETVPSIDGYTFYHVGFLYGLTNVAIGLDHLFTDRLWTVAYWEVKDGKLDHMFLRPLPILFQVIASEIQLEAFGEIIVAIAMLIICGVNLDFSVGVGSALIIILGIVCGAIIISSFKVMVASFAFKFKKSGPLMQFIYNFTNYAKYPMKIFPKVIQILLTVVIPVGLCIYYPFENIFSPLEKPWLLVLVIIGFTSVFSSICLLVWKRFVKLYESTGT